MRRSLLDIGEGDHPIPLPNVSATVLAKVRSCSLRMASPKALV